MTVKSFLPGHDEEFDRLVRQEELILQVTEVLTQALEDAGMKKGALARRLGKSPGFVSQVFGGGRNLTLRTVADIAGALSLRPRLALSSVQDSLLGNHARRHQGGWRSGQRVWPRRPRKIVVAPPPVSRIQHETALPPVA